MSEYSKLTVIKLREELTKRGLPKTGLKPVLVNRLIEDDARAENPHQVPKTHDPEDSVTEKGEEPLTEKDEVDQNAPPAVEQTQLESEQGQEKSEDNAPRISKSEDSEASGAAVSTSAPILDKGTILPLQDSPISTDVQEVSPEKPSTEVSNSISAVAGAIEKPESPLARNQLLETQQVNNDVPNALIEASQKELSAEAPDLRPSLEDEVNGQGPTQALVDNAIVSGIPNIDADRAATHGNSQELPTKAMFNPSSEQDPETVQESIEDKKKRKRRSQSPPPISAEVAQKKLKVGDSRPNVKLPEDLDMEDVQDQILEQPDSTLTAGDIPTEEPEDAHLNGFIQQPQGAESDQAIPPESAETPDRTLLALDAIKPQTLIQSDTTNATAKSPVANTLSKQSPPDTRFKNLFPSSSDRSIPAAHQLAPPERNIAPALHPATPALYIRNFMRPINPSNLKEYLITLATSSSTSPSSQVVTEFFLDPIRTHCFIAFSSTTAACRVRSSLHERVWPDERNRPPLWVDFVPEEKLKLWIDVEQSAGSGRGQAAKRWEVVYEEEEKGIMAYLQEAGPGNSSVRQNQSRHKNLEERGQGMQGAPLGPRSKDNNPHSSQTGEPSRPAVNEKGFQALDDLFLSTVAKPKLYYLPVSKSIANKRLDRLDEGRGGGRGDEMRRYTFEEGVLVDRGPEFGYRGRGGHGGRSGAHSGYQSGHRGGYQGGYHGRYHGGYHGRNGGYKDGDRRDRK